MQQLDPVMGVLIPYINFAIFLGLLIYFARKPISAATLKRKEDFEKLLEVATSARTEAEEENRRLQQRLREVETELAEISDQTQARAKDDAERMLQQAEELASHIRSEAKRVAEAELQRAENQIRSELIDAARSKVEEQLKSGLTATDHQALVDKRCGEMATVQVGS